LFTFWKKLGASNETLSPDEFRGLMRYHASAVAVVAAGAPGRRAGLTVTALTALSDDPATILVCLQRKSGTHDIVRSAKAFAVNLLASDQQDIADRFSGRTGVAGEARFHGVTWAPLATGAPILASALVSLDCELLDQHEFSTHSVFFGRVVAGSCRGDAEPLLYFRTDYTGLAKS